MSLEQKLIKLIDEVVKGIDRVERYEPSISVTERGTQVTIDYCGERGGDNFFTPRQGEEDDDWPDFTGQGKIVKGLKRYLGKQCRIEAYDHEKGHFSVSVFVPKQGVKSETV